MTYQWTLSGGTITNPGGTSGQLVGSTNQITFTAGPVGTIAITCVEINAAQTASAPGTAKISMMVRVSGLPIST